MKTISLNKTAAKWFVLGMLMALPLLGHAEDGSIGDTTFSIGPRATYVDPKGADKAAWFGGAQMRIHFAKALALEGSVDYYRVLFNTDYRFRVYPVQASLLAYLTPQYRVSPYIIGGAGWYFTRFEGPNGLRDTKDRAGLHAGGGLEIKINESLSFDGSYRYIWLESVKTRDISAIDKEYDGGGAMMTVALNFNF